MTATKHHFTPASENATSDCISQISAKNAEHACQIEHNKIISGGSESEVPELFTGGRFSTDFIIPK